MPRKRKAAGNKSCSEDTKRVKTSSQLCELPTEILDLILSYVIPDPKQLDYAADSHSTAFVFPWGPLQTCMHIRQRALHLIQEFTWMHVQFPSHKAFSDFRDDLTELPLLPKKRLHLISGAPTIRFNCMSSSASDKNDHDEHDTHRPNQQTDCHLPFNFASLIRINDYISRQPPEVVTGFEVSCIQMNARAETEMEKLVIPAFSNLRFLKDFKFERNTTKVLSIDIGKTVCGTDWNLDQFIERAQHILTTADVLTKAGHIDASDMLLLSSTWLSDEAQSWLPNPDSWALGELILEDDSPETRYPGRCVKGNRLRQLLFRIEHQACRSLYRLVDKFDWDWYMVYQTMFGVAYERFIRGYHFTWFGASTLEIAEINFGRAIVLEMLSRRRWRHGLWFGREWAFELPEPSEIWYTYRVDPKRGRRRKPLYKNNLNDEDGDAFFGARLLAYACALDPQNSEYSEAHAALTKRCGPRKLKRIEKRCSEDLVVLEDLAEKKESRRPIWVGDTYTLHFWAGMKGITEWLPLAQKGLNIDLDVEDWLSCNLSQKEIRLFTQQGYECVER